MRKIIIIFILLILKTKFSDETLSQTITFRTNQTFEITLTSEKTYINPQSDVTIKAIFFLNNIQYTVTGFWDGNNIFKIRFALPFPGIWNYKVICNDEMNNKLHNITGEVVIVSYEGTNLLYKNGPLKVSKNNRYLTYLNDSPFFYLGDTAWEITWKSTKSEFLKYISDRKTKGFSVIQVVIMSHQRMEEKGVQNRYGEWTFFDSNYTKVNPKYYEYLDFIVQTANDSGIVVALVPLWAALSEVNFASEYHRFYIPIEQSLKYAKYIAARYAGNKIIWIIGGDNSYNTNNQKNFWSNFANVIIQNSGGLHLQTVHPQGWSASFDYFDNTTSWLSFHMYQSSHVAGGEFTWKAAERGYNLLPIKPVLNGEACYEDIYNNCWAPGDTTHVNTFRLKPEHVRQASYESILSGALVGITYGANGIWQWHKKDLPGSHEPRFTFDSAMHFPGSDHMSFLKSFMINNNWQNLVPDQSLIKDFKSDAKIIPVATKSDTSIIYFPPNTEYIILKNQFVKTISYSWINPVSGDQISDTIIPDAQFIRFQPPDKNDWLLILTDYFNGQNRFSNNFILFQNYPNPFNSSTNISFQLNYNGYITLKIFNILGMQVDKLIDNYLPSKYYNIKWDSKNLPSGVYFYQLQFGSQRENKSFILLK